METNPQHYGLTARTILEPLDRQHIAIVKLVKSRIIRKDAEKITDNVRHIRRVAPELQVSLICTRNICSKSIKLLADEGINIHYREIE